MNPGCSSQRLAGLLGRRGWLLLLAAAIVVVFAIMTRSRSSFPSAGVDVVLNTNGIATVLGIPLGSGPARDLTLRALSKGHVPVTVVLPSGGSLSPGWGTNAPLTLQAIISAGLIPTNKPSGPSPYE